MARKVALARLVSLALLLLLVLLALRADTLNLGATLRLAGPYAFSIEQWELANFLSKWRHRVQSFLWGKEATPSQRQALVREYFRLGEEARRLEDELERLAARGGLGARGGPSSATIDSNHSSVAAVQARLRLIQARRSQMRDDVEETLEAVVSAVAQEEGLRQCLGRLCLFFPPVDFRFDPLPRTLVTSPRERIELKDSLLLRGDMTLEEMEALERKGLISLGLSALVEDVGGVATYPALVSDEHSLRTVLQIAAHEWLHHYLIFKPLGRRYWASAELRTLNETLADMAGRELGDLAYIRLGGTIPYISPSPDEAPVAPGKAEFNFNQEMRLTRQHVDELLAQGRIAEAEAYMEERRFLFVENEYSLRKLNQAYFAFHGSYAEGPASVSPIASQLNEVRMRLPSLGTFVMAVSGFGSYDRFLEYLTTLRASP